MEESEIISLYKKFYVELCQIANRYMQDTALAEDIVQNFFISLLNKKEVNINVNPSGFLKRSIVNACLNELNKSKKFNFLQVENGEEELACQPIETLETTELKKKIKLAINSLSPKCRTIFLLKKKENYTNKEIAEYLSISVKTVENQMTIALKNLQKLLK